MIEVVGSKVVTRRPVDLTRADPSASEDDADDESIPCNRTLSPGPSGEDDIYQAPVALTPASWKKNKAMVLADDTAVESSKSDRDIVVEKEEMVQKKRQVLSSVADKVP